MRLKESGFVDAEGEDSRGEVILIDCTSPGLMHGKSTLYISSRAEYYRLIAQCVVSEKNFDDEFDRFIMEKTAEGFSIKEISDALRKMVPPNKKRTKFYRNTIRFVRRRYENKWGIRSWLPEQMTSKKPLTK